MIEEIITINTAKLAKDKGFDIPTLFWYFKNNQAGEDFILVDYIGEGQFGNILYPENHNSLPYILPRLNACTQSLLQKWLREVYNLHINISPYFGKEYDERGIKLWETLSITNLKTETNTVLRPRFKLYEEALEFGLQEALKLLPDKKSENS